MEANPPFRPLAPAATSRPSTTATETPCSSSRQAHEAAVTPAPTMQTSALAGPASAPYRRAGASSCQKEGPVPGSAVG